MVGIVIVSHTARLAEGVAELARAMGGDVTIEVAGGLDLPGQPVGTDAALVAAAVERAWSDDGVLVLMDLGSAVLSAEMALDLLPEQRRGRVLLCEAPLVEGAVAAAVTARLGEPLERVAAEARNGLAAKAAHLGQPAAAPEQGAAPSGGRPARSLTLTVANPLGLHARPAARLVQAASRFDADVQVTNLTAGTGPVPARSLSAVATLGARQGHEILVEATGDQAAAALAAIRELAEANFGDEGGPAPPRPAAAPPPPAAVAAGPRPAPAPGTELRGLPASPGLAAGPARHLAPPPAEPAAGPPAAPQEELGALDAALAATREEVSALRARVAARAGGQEAAIFDAHLLLLEDEAILAPARRAILEEGQGAARAFMAAAEQQAARWEALDDEYLRARAGDLRAVARQVLAHLTGTAPARPAPARPGIAVAADLTPAETAALDPAATLGIATALGAPTAHSAILARALGIPAVVGLGPDLLAVADGTELLLDGERGVVTVAPPPEAAARFQARRREREAAARAWAAAAREPATTRDGIRIEVAANVGGPGEVPAAVAAGADAVGLLRTEFLFMGRAAMPGEEEQEAAYRQAAELLEGRPLTLRTLDAGADKPLPYLPRRAEANPFLGVRGLRLGLAAPDLLAAQLRAALRVAADHPLRIMFPMVATVEELRAARAALAAAQAQLAGEGVPAPRSLEVGVMVEVPAAALTAGALAGEVDFFSIGTNDLTQYTLAAERGNPEVAALNDALHPAVLRLIRLAVDAAEARGRWVGVCGELAGDPAATALLVGLGVRELSLAPPAIPAVKHAVRQASAAEARALAKAALACATAAEVRELLGTA